MKKIKPELSLKQIGTLRFWLGTFIGIFFSTSLCFLLNYSTEILRYFTGQFGDQIYISSKAKFQLEIFFAALSTTAGFSLAMWFWLSGIRKYYPKQKLHKRLNQVNSILAIWIPLLFITRIGTILFTNVYAIRGYDNSINLLEEFKIILVLIPLVIFFQNWLNIRLVFKINRWPVFSILAVLSTSTLLVYITSVDTNKIDTNYKKRFENEYQYIDYEILHASKDYNIQYSKATIKTLKEWHTIQSLNQVESVKNAFENSGSVSLDTIILQKIIIRNFKNGIWQPQRGNLFYGWDYAKPLDILKQIKNAKYDRKRTKELIEIINEQIILVNHLSIDRSKVYELDQLSRRKAIGSRHKIPYAIIIQLEEVIKKLQENNQIVKHNIVLKELNTNLGMK